MARQAGPIPFTGTLGEITGYQVNGKFFLKRKSEVSRYRLLHSASYAASRATAASFGDTSRITRKVYRQLPKGATGQKVWHAMRRRTHVLLKKQLPQADIIAALTKEFLLPAQAKKGNTKPAARPKASEVLELGRAYGRIDPVATLVEQLAAVNSLMRQLLQKKEEGLSQQPQRFRQTTRLRSGG